MTEDTTPWEVRDTDILTTKGVTSKVFPEAEGEDVDPLGHVLLMDYDAGTASESQLEDETDRPGFNILAESSPGSYHYWNLTVMPKEVLLREMCDLHGDANHIVIGWRRRRWTLRIAPKKHMEDVDEDAEYKSKPKLKAVWYNETDTPQSRGHYDLMRAVWDVPDISDKYDINWRGHSAGFEEYVTVTDELMKRWSPDG